MIFIMVYMEAIIELELYLKTQLNLDSNEQ